MNNQSTFKVLVEKLEFDRHNPRLVVREVDLLGASDESIMCALVEDADIGELISSIYQNNYLDIEPLIVTKDKIQESDHYRVLEGNRRLAAIRFYQNPDIARQCRLRMPKDIPDSVFESIKEVTVYEVENASEARAFIGYKHVNGAHRWDSYAKARFISEWYETEYENGITIDEIAHKLGDNNQNVRALISGMLVLKQAEDEELFEISNRTKPGAFGFSHLYTALGRIEYRNFLGLEKNWNHRPATNPVPESKVDNLKEVLDFIYGSKKEDKPSVIKSQNPDLKTLGQVIANPIALKVLRSTNNLIDAEEEIKNPADVFQDALIIAHSKVQDTVKKLSKYSQNSDDDLLRIAKEMLNGSRIIVASMQLPEENE